MIFSEALRLIEHDRGRMRRLTRSQNGPRLSSRPRSRVTATRERLERRAIWKDRQGETGGTGGQRVGGNDPGFGRTRLHGPGRQNPLRSGSVATGVVPAHSL